MQISYEPPADQAVDARLTDARRLIRQLRLDRRLSQREAAERAGLDQPTWSRLERGEMTLTLEHALRIQHALGIPTLEALIGPLPSQLT